MHILFFLSCAFLVASGEKKWFAGRNFTKDAIGELTTQGCFYGTYGQDLHLLSCDAPRSLDVWYLGTWPETNRLCVFETSVSVPSVLSQLERAVVMHTSGRILYARSQELVVLVSSVTQCFRLIPTDGFNVTISNVISVPEQPYRTQLETKTVRRVPSTVISDALLEVSESQLQANVEFLASYSTRNSYSTGAQDAQKWLSQQFSSYGFSVTNFPFQTGFSEDVVAELAGSTDRSKYVVVGAHYDSRSTNTSSPTQVAPGADDNASGVAALLELARIISLQKLQFAYTIQIVAFSGEEQGLVGSRAYAKTFGADSVVAMFNADMLGYKLPNQTITLGMKDRFISVPLLEASIELTRLYLPTLPVALSTSCCSDYQSFYELGFPAIGFFQNSGVAADYPYYHTSQDLPIYLNWQQMGLETQAVMATALTYAEPVTF